MSAAQQLRRRSPRADSGFAFVAAVFLLVIVSAMAAFVLRLAASTSAAAALSVQGVRAYEAARAGLEWSSHRLRDPNGTFSPGPTALPDCFASPYTLALPGDLASFALQLTCERHPAAGNVPGFHEEGDKRSVYFVVTATASSGSAGDAEYIERRLEARIEVCKDPAAVAPAYPCG